MSIAISEVESDTKMDWIKSNHVTIEIQANEAIIALGRSKIIANSREKIVTINSVNTAKLNAKE